MVYLNSCNEFPLFAHGYLCVLILDCSLIHTSYINTQTKGSLGLCPHICVCKCGLHTSILRQKQNKPALPTGEVICSSSHYYWLDLFI